jgi:hypothetical protein
MSILFADLKEAYTNACKKGKETFNLDNQTYVTVYAKYLIQYLEMQECPDNMILEVAPKKEVVI